MGWTDFPTSDNPDFISNYSRNEKDNWFSCGGKKGDMLTLSASEWDKKGGFIIGLGF